MSRRTSLSGCGLKSARRKSSLSVQDHECTRKLNLPLLRQIVRVLLTQIAGETKFHLQIHIVDSEQIARLNETYVRHPGVTDVITFDYTESAEEGLSGEIFVCLPVAVSQARRFRTTWPSELVRYIVHGVLHLLGHNDHRHEARRRMKAAEDALVRRLARQFAIPLLGRS